MALSQKNPVITFLEAEGLVLSLTKFSVYRAGQKRETWKIKTELKKP
jgi:hypothetical protein